MADPRIQAPTSETNSSSSSSCGFATKEVGDAASNCAVNVEVDDTWHSSTAIAGGEMVEVEELPNSSMSAYEDPTSMSVTAVQDVVEDIEEGAIKVEVEYTRHTSTAIAGGAVKRYTGPIPTLRAGDWISYYFQVLNFNEVVHILT